MTAADGRTAAELLRAGFRRGFVAAEPRLAEAVAAYRELGFEVVLLPVADDEPGCTECLRREPDRYRAIYVRRGGGPAAGG
jgi:hypothetical protein